MDTESNLRMFAQDAFVLAPTGWPKSQKDLNELAIDAYKSNGFKQAGLTITDCKRIVHEEYKSFKED